MQLMFVCLLILYSAVFLLAQIVFLWFLEFFAYKNRDRFTSSFEIGMPFVSFCFFLCAYYPLYIYFEEIFIQVFGSFFDEFFFCC